MALLIRSIRNESAAPIVLRIPGFEPNQLQLRFLPGVTVDLLPLSLWMSFRLFRHN